ncbi:MAG TPA: hypothetical protein DGB72_04980 [Gemmatimonadetes bacterium]|jgi:hypothetical protein|nr:hypothetical protein [Gemmatimonadota bacterium]
MPNRRYLLSFAIMLASPLSVASAQQGYEFEVYDTHLTTPGTTEFELNANFVASGRKQIENGLFPTHHMLRSSFEIGRGLTNWLEASAYVLGVHQSGIGSSYVGNRIRVTASAPSAWNLPVEFGLTQEIGYARPGFAENRWTYELSPMIGKTWGPLAVAFNPVFERSLAGETSHPVEFEPKARVGYGIGAEGSISLEYYSTLGPTSGFDPRSEQKHQLFVAFEKEWAEDWEMAVSVGRGLTSSSDHGVVATRFEYRIGH